MNKNNDDIDNTDDFDYECGCNLCYTTRTMGQFFMNLIPNNRYFRNPFMFCLYFILFLIVCFLILALFLALFIEIVVRPFI